MIRCDKTFSELWNLTESKDLLVAEAARMAIKTIEEFQEENRKQRQEIEQLKKSGNDLNNDLFHERTEKERLSQEIEKQQQEIERLKQEAQSRKYILNKSLDTEEVDNLEVDQEAICISGMWKGYKAYWEELGLGRFAFRYKSPDGTILNWLEDEEFVEDDSEWRIIADVSPLEI